MFVYEIKSCFSSFIDQEDFGYFNIDYEEKFVTENIIPKSKLYSAGCIAEIVVRLLE